MKYLKEYGLMLLLFVILIGLLLTYYLRVPHQNNVLSLDILPSDTIKMTHNSLWNPTLKILWNDLAEKVIGEDIVFTNDKENIYVNELNQSFYDTDNINDEYYYKNYDYMTSNFHEIIKNDLMEKFNDKSELLEGVKYDDNSRDYLLYTMMVRHLTFDSSSISNIRVLFYEDKNNYAVRLLTINDEIILYKGERKDNIKETFSLLKSKISERSFTNTDSLKVANINFKNESEFNKIINKDFYDINMNKYMIKKVLQTVVFSLNGDDDIVINDCQHSEYCFNFKDDFMLFVKEKNHDYPYLAININDIKKFN